SRDPVGRRLDDQLPVRRLWAHLDPEGLTMARDHARVNVTIWGDPDFRALPAPAQHLYLTLWTAPRLSYCGVHDWRPGRIAARSTGLTADDIETIAQCLEARHFL